MSNKDISNVSYRTKIETSNRNLSTNLSNIDIISNVIKKARETLNVEAHDLVGYCFFSRPIELKDFKSKFGDDGTFFKHVITSKTSKKKNKLSDSTVMLECHVWTPELCGMLPFPEKLLPIKDIISNTAGREEADEVLEAIADIVKKLAPEYVKKPKVRSMDQGPSASKYLKKVQGLEKDLRKIAMLPKYYKLNENLETVPFGQMVRVRHEDEWTAASSWHAGSLEETLSASWDFTLERGFGPRSGETDLPNPGPGLA